jgi:holo-[acyl-carrier protein] synthase
MKVGTDIVAIKRLERSIEKFGDRFTARYLNPEEIARTRTIESYAGLWAAKEAVAKALGCGIGATLSFHDILIDKDNHGAPHFTLSPKAQKHFRIQESSLSISHDGGFAIAVVVIVLDE